MRALRLIVCLGIAALAGCLAPNRKTSWTKTEVIQWYAKNGEMVRGGLGYQGSDQQHHHFIARVLDEWAFIEINKMELKLEDERPFLAASNAPLAYYAVDPRNNFKKVEAKKP